MIGKNISHYKILEELGRGGMGMVYKARDTKLDRLVALKFLAPHLSQDEEQKARFIHEAKAASALDHPNICNIYEINETEDGQMFIAMACYEGESLQDKIKRGPLPVKDALHIAFQIIRGLEKAHSKGIVHRDIKPANILITNDGQIKIVDFGLAKLASRGMLTREGTTLGTVAYMSPEQTRGTEIDHQTDIWSLGVVLYEMLTGEQPFKGDYEQAVVYSILHEEPEQINGTLSNRVPQELPAVIGKMLSKEVNQRYQNMAELLQQLLKIEKKIETGTEVSGSPGKSAPSIAVLPFVNMSADPENEYFSDGLTEEIIASLSKIRSLKVISRTSIMHYKKSNKPLKQIAGELQVQYVLEGSVRKYGNDLRITAQLIEAAQDTNVWVDKYRGNIEDVFEIQEKVALEIAQALSLQLSPNEEKNLRKRSTENSDAYQLYLKGRYSWYKRTEEGVRNGIEFFKQAIEKDPTYALAQVGIADSYNILGFYSVLAPKEAFP